MLLRHRSGQEPWQNVADEIDQPMANHVGNQIALPEVKRGQDSSKRKGDKDVRPPTGPMADGEMSSGIMAASQRPRLTITSRARALSHISASFVTAGSVPNVINHLPDQQQRDELSLTT